jgi:hypothetical protein
MRLAQKKDPNFSVSCEYKFSYGEAQSNFLKLPFRFVRTYQFVGNGGHSFQKVGLLDDGQGAVELANSTPLIFKITF